MTTWRQQIKQEMEEQNEQWTDTIERTLTEEELDLEFDSGFGGVEGVPFTLWTEQRVYFPVTYDGAEWCGSVSRNPDFVATEHLGG